MMNNNSKLVKFVSRYFNRAYYRWEISKKKKSYEELTQFEKKFIMVLKRICLLQSSEFNYSYTEGAGRIVSNLEAGITIQIKGNEIRFIDSDMLTVFFVREDLARYFSAIFDRATELRTKRQEDEILNVQLNHIRSVEQILIEVPKRKSSQLTLTPKMVKRRRHQSKSTGIFEITVGD